MYIYRKTWWECLIVSKYKSNVAVAFSENAAWIQWPFSNMTNAKLIRIWTVRWQSQNSFTRLIQGTSSNMKHVSSLRGTFSILIKYVIDLMYYRLSSTARNNHYKMVVRWFSFLSHQLICLHIWYHLSHVMRKPVLAICEQQRRRSACASAQSDPHLCCSLPS